MDTTPKPRQRIRPLTSEKVEWEARESKLSDLLTAARIEAERARRRFWVLVPAAAVLGFVLGLVVGRVA